MLNLHCNSLFCKAQIAFLRKELSEKEMPKYEVDILSIFATQVQQRLQQQEEKEKQLQLKKLEQLYIMEKMEHVEQIELQRHKELKPPHFDCEA